MSRIKESVADYLTSMLAALVVVLCLVKYIWKPLAAIALVVIAIQLTCSP